MALNNLFNSSMQQLSNDAANHTIRGFFFLSDWLSQKIIEGSLKIGFPLNAQAAGVAVTLLLVYLFIKTINKINNSLIKYGIYATIIWLLSGFLIR